MAEAAAVPVPQPLYFVDATQPAYDAHPACGRVQRGETRTLNSKHGRVDVTSNGALGWPGREVVTREAQKITGPEMVAFLQDLDARQPQAKAIHVLDNAPDNRAATAREWLATPGCRLRLVDLPPYAPNLNLIERLWCFFKKKTLWNHHYPSLAAFKAAIRAFFTDLTPWRDELASLITDRLHFIGAEPTQIPTA